MTRLAVLFTSAVILVAVPFGSAGPACARKHWQQQSCIEQCKGKWGYPGLMMGSSRFGDVIQKAATDDWSSIIASACGTSTASSASATSVAGAVGHSPTITQSELTTQVTLSSSSSVLSSSSAATSVSVSVATSAISSSSSEVVSSTSSVAPTPTPSSSSTEEQPSSTEQQPPSTSTSVFIPPTTSSTVEQAAPTTSSTPAPPATSAASSSSSSSDSSSGSGSNGSGASDSDVQAYLSAHNSLRAQHGASALTWSNDAAAKAQQWANGCVFQHSGGSLGPFGENLAAGTGDGYGIPQAIASWANEASQYDPSNPQASHFTQMVWKATTQVGCALAQCNGIFDPSFGLAHYYVCEYSPQGNVIGEFAQNVQA